METMEDLRDQLAEALSELASTQSTLRHMTRLYEEASKGLVEAGPVLRTAMLRHSELQRVIREFLRTRSDLKCKEDGCSEFGRFVVGGDDSWLHCEKHHRIPRVCAQCGHPEFPHRYRHYFKADPEAVVTSTNPPWLLQFERLLALLDYR